MSRRATGWTALVYITTPDIDLCVYLWTYFDEVMRGINKLKNGRSAGSDEIPPELIKCALPHTAAKVLQ